MSLLSKIFQNRTFSPEDLNGKSIGKLITEATNGTLLVDGKATYEIAYDKKNDLDTMYKCCESEIEKYNITGLAPAPYYFERVAILARKIKNYDLEVNICEEYIKLMNQVYGAERIGIKAGPRYAAIENRLQKAKQLQKKSL